MYYIFGGTDKSVPYDGDTAKFQFICEIGNLKLMSDIVKINKINARNLVDMKSGIS